MEIILFYFANFNQISAPSLTLAFVAKLYKCKLQEVTI